MNAILAAFTALTMMTTSTQPPAAEAPAPAAAPAEPGPGPEAAPTSWDQVQSTTTVTTTTTTNAPPPAVVPAPAPAPAVTPPPPRRRDPASSALIGTGAGLLGIGVISMLFIAAPAALVKRVALRRANDEDALAFSSRETRYHRARIADDTMEAAFWVGISAVVVGTVLLTTGAVLRNRADRPARTAQHHRRATAKVRLDGGPGGLRLRF
jgi:hypothetical protein